MAKAEAESSRAMKVLRDSDILWRIEGQQKQTLTGLLVSTPQLTAGKVFLLPGQQTELEVHGGDKPSTCWRETSLYASTPRTPPHGLN